MRTRKLSRPRITGRLAPPGAKVEAVTPGRVNSASPRVLGCVRSISARGITVTGENVLSTMMKGPAGLAAGSHVSAPAGSAAGGAKMGLGAVTVMAGNSVMVCASAVEESSSVPEAAARERRGEQRITDPVEAKTICYNITKPLCVNPVKLVNVGCGKAFDARE